MREKLLKSEKGFTLIEVLVTTAISGILTLAGASIINLTVSYFFQTVNAMNTQSDIIMAMYQIKSAMANAIDLRRSTAVPINGAGDEALPADRMFGEIRSGTFAGAGGARHVIAVFNREVNLTGDLTEAAPTALVYQEPNGNATSGAIWVHTRPESGFGVYQIDLDKAGSTRIPRIVRFQVPIAQMKGLDPTAARPVVRQAQNGDYVVSAQFQVRFRVTRGNDPQTWCWSVNLGGCGAATSGGRDINQTISVNFRNNRIYNGAGGARQDYRVYGGVYFFLQTGPTVVQ